MCLCCCKPFGRHGRWLASHSHLHRTCSVLRHCILEFFLPYEPLPPHGRPYRCGYNICHGNPPQVHLQLPSVHLLPHYRVRLTPTSSTGHCCCLAENKRRRCSNPRWPHRLHLHPALIPLSLHCMMQQTFCLRGGPCGCVQERPQWSSLLDVDLPSRCSACLAHTPSNHILCLCNSMVRRGCWQGIGLWPAASDVA